LGRLPALQNRVNLLQPILQDPAYHRFADSRTLLAVPNFWNVATNLPFLAVAVWGLRATLGRDARPCVFRRGWERAAHVILLLGVAGVAFGSAWYHLRPTDATLFWDRLPMAVVFTVLVAVTVAERVSAELGRRLLGPLLAAGAASVIYWRATGDLRAYGIVQFGALLAVALLVALRAPAYTQAKAVWAAVALYSLAKLAELGDHAIAGALPTGGHPLKHLLAAAALAVYVAAVARRRPCATPLTPPRSIAPGTGATPLTPPRSIAPGTGATHRSPPARAPNPSSTPPPADASPPPAPTAHSARHGYPSAPASG
jgi:hypothetical protein